MAQLLYASKITRVRFSIAGTDDVLMSSHVPITSYDLFKNGLPYPGGLYDGHLGTTDHSYRCQTCYNGKKNCLGHDGHLLLNYPVISPIAFSEVKKWLKIICFNCGQPIIKDSDFIRFTKNKRLDEASKIARAGSRKCVYCGEVHPIIARDKNDMLTIYAEYYEDKTLVERKKLYPHFISQILSRIDNDVVLKLGKHLSSHPRNFILRAIKVPPTTIRPDVKKMSGGRSNNDDLTTLLQYIAKKNEAIPIVFEEPINPKLDRSIAELGATYYDFVKGGGAGKRVISTGSQPLNSLALRLRGKQGRLRKNMMGRRVKVVCRSTITGDTTLQINEVGMPMKFAKTLQIKETVQEYNKQQLMIYFNNGRDKYPGCTKIVKASTGTEHSIDSIRENFELEIGDQIYRDIVTGDVFTFNRQPSLKPSNIGCHRIVVTEDPEILTLRMNVIACPLYDADFDGDLIYVEFIQL